MTTLAEESSVARETVVSKPPGFGVRYVQVFLLFTGLTVAYSLRVNLSVGIVAMTNNDTNPDFETFDWNESSRSLVLSSFFWGYCILQVPAGVVAQKYGAKLIMLTGIGLCSVSTLLVPLFASIGGWPLMCALRMFQGLCQGLVYPCTHSVLSKWAPIPERGFLNTFSYAGTQFGTVLMLGTSGVLASSAGGWPSIFYVSGGVGCVWCIFWYLFATNLPSEHKLIKPAELAYIESSLGAPHKGSFSTPWKKIFTSVPFLALLFTHMGQNWGFWTLLTEIPSYMNSVLKVDIKANALLSALPYFVMMVMSFIMSPLSDWLMNKGYISTSTGRKIFNTIAYWGPAFALIGLGYAQTLELAVFLLTMAVGLNAGTYLGYMVNHMDLAPNFAGTLMGITNGIANILSILGPLFVGIIVDDETNADLWRIVFFVAAGIYLVSNTIFIVFGSGNLQPWNDDESEEKTVEKKL